MSGQHVQRHGPRRHPCRFTQTGYSIYDMLVTSAVAGVFGLGAIAMNGMLRDARLTASANQLMGDLNLSRSEAIKRNTSITLCKSRDGASCSSAAAWHEGWIVFTDHNRNREVDADESILHLQQALAGDMTLRYGETGAYSYVRYNATGEAVRAATFTFCDPRGPDKARAVIVYWTGRPRVSTRTSEGRPLRCP